MGKKRFYQWYRRSVMTGVVDASTLLGGTSASAPRPEFRRPVPVWLWVVGGIVVVVVALIGLQAARRETEF